MRMALVLSLGILANPVVLPAAERIGVPSPHSQLRQPGEFSRSGGSQAYRGGPTVQTQPQAYRGGAMAQMQPQTYRGGSMAQTQSQAYRGGSTAQTQPPAYRGRSTAQTQSQAYRGGAMAQTQPDPRVQESAVTQRIGGVQQQLANEQQRLQNRLAEFNRMREAALEKQDQKQLNAIEQLERQTVEAYQQRIDRLVSGLSLESGAQRNQGNPHPRAQSVQQNGQPKPQAPPKQRNWFLPFGR